MNTVNNPFKPLDDISMRSFHLKYMLVAAMGTFTDGYDLTVLGVVLPYVLMSYGISSLKSPAGVFWSIWLNALPVLGFFVGAPLFGYLSNLGRKTFYGWDALLMAVGAAFQPFMPNLILLGVARFIMGIGLGADYVLSPTIIAEVSNARDRGKLLALGFGGFWIFGSAVAAIAVLIMLIAGFNPGLIWRVALGIGAVWPAGVIYLRRRFPETPRYSVIIAKNFEEFRRFMMAIFGAHYNIQPQHGTLNHEEAEEIMLFRKYLKYIALGALLWLIFDIPAYGLNFFVSYIAQSIKMTPVYLQLLGTAFTLPGIVLAWLLLDRWGRRNAQGYGFLLTGLTFLIFSYFVYTYSRSPNAAALLFLPTIISFGLAKTWMQMGPGSVVAVGAHGVEFSPTKIRGIGQAINVISGRTGVLITTFVFPTLFVASSYTAYIFLGLVSVIGAVLTFTLIPETKGLGLEDISLRLSGDS
ncbi:MFS transporter [Vulcanisaeta distributa]|uniref:General substrate transporter n=1 Tax=Vulcanisaeta distributa (strain DSM 14429 / JCM 11212 / NBRC 100878 / IC-017) TaxID=572478 RepID=E1QUX2_VULDI|nr:MFS transporter [Vulcanisaeta distributa]ADN49975.1 General substrate transporter [Vulcanisaeta distributa DSM 14429]